ncbi:MAG: hypothetical protein KatS3mg113_0227 [Planctomycetaceae bacterium]|nr:MAG: hypothetical protein KatS3mg113_0227 [Planctomycetaceae bacterium]
MSGSIRSWLKMNKMSDDDVETAVDLLRNLMHDDEKLMKIPFWGH